MGAFLVNFHVKTAVVEPIRDVFKKLKIASYRITTPHKGWITVYEEQASTQDDRRINNLASKLSSSLKTCCMAFMVHDSDIACYWLYDQGKLLDEYNSAPDYFDAVSKADKKRLQGQPVVLHRFCKPGVTLDEVTKVLGSEPTFADDIVMQLADLLGIQPERALADYRDDEDESFEGDDTDDDDSEEEDVDKPRTLRFPQPDTSALTERMKKQFDALMGSAGNIATQPQSDALAQAAAEGDLAQVNELLKSGVDVNAPGKLSMQKLSSVGQPLPPNPLWSLAISPLFAASSRGQAQTVTRLVEKGARLDEIHPALGSALHVAAQAGSPETVTVLLKAGVPADLRNAQGQTARDLLVLILHQVQAAKDMIKSMPGLGKTAEKLLGPRMPEAGWAACETLLRQAGG